MKPGELRVEDVIFALNATRGILSYAAERLGCARSSLYKFLKRSPRAMDVHQQWREQLVDRAELSLWQCLSDNQGWAVALVLKSRNGVSRGWGDAEAADRRHTAILLASARELGVSAVELIAEMEDMFDEIERRPDETPSAYARKLEQLLTKAQDLERVLQHSAQPPWTPPPSVPVGPVSSPPDPDEARLSALEAHVRGLVDDLRGKVPSAAEDAGHPG